MTTPPIVVELVEQDIETVAAQAGLNLSPHFGCAYARTLLAGAGGLLHKIGRLLPEHLRILADHLGVPATVDDVTTAITARTESAVTDRIEARVRGQRGWKPLHPDAPENPA